MKNFPTHLISIADLSEKEIQKILSESKSDVSKKQKRYSIKFAPTWGLLFLEPSTRTRASFELAAQDLNCKTLHFETKGSSLEKGETLKDMVENLEAMGLYHFVLRQSDRGALEVFRQKKNLRIINAGDGGGEHPTQALLDAATLHWKIGSLRGLRLLIQGDLTHSRVARSWSLLAPRLQIDLKLSSPESLKPRDWDGEFEWSANPKDFYSHVDVVMCLRVQKERFQESESLGKSQNQIETEFCLSPKFLKSNQFVMAPGPVNWGIELSSEFQGDRRSLILDQVKMGRVVRKLLLQRLSL